MRIHAFNKALIMKKFSESIPHRAYSGLGIALLVLALMPRLGMFNRRINSKQSSKLFKSEGRVMKNQKGFSLIELLIVVAIIGIIAAIAVPNLLQSKAAANEASAIASCRNLVTAEITYYTTKGSGKYGALADLQKDRKSTRLNSSHVRI